MGITTDEFFENIYSVIFSPKEFFMRKDMTISIRLALCTIIFVSAISKTTKAVFDSSILNVPVFISALISSIIVAVFLWFVTALFFEYIAKIFGKDGNLSALLYYTAFVPVPYILFAPLNIFKNIGAFGYIIATLTEFSLYIWMIILYAYSLRTACNITLARAFMIIILPFLSIFFAIIWMICFFSKLCYIFSI